MSKKRRRRRVNRDPRPNNGRIDAVLLQTLSGRPSRDAFELRKMLHDGCMEMPSNADESETMTESDYTIDAIEGGQKVLLSIKGVIGGEGIDASKITADLEKTATTSAKEILVLVNSRGGDVFDAVSIYNTLVDMPQRVVAKVIGVAASAATLLIMAADERRMASNANFMVP